MASSPANDPACTLPPVGTARRRWLLGLSATSVALIGVGALTVPSWIKRKAIDSARARGIELAIEQVRPRFGHLELVGVQASLEGVSDASARVASIDVGWSLSGVTSIDARGVTVDLQARPDELKSAVHAWRERHPAGGGAPSSSSRRLGARDVSLRWRVLGIEWLTASAQEVGVGSGKVTLRGAHGEVTLPGFVVSATGVDTEITRESGKLGAVAIDQLTFRPDLASAALAAGLAGAVPSGPTEAASSEVGPWRHVTKMRALIEKVVERFEPGVEVKVHELVLRTEQGTLGPWASRLVIGTDALGFELDPGEKDGRKPLVMRALIPRGRGKWSAELKMGPATLAELGVQEGMLGLSGVETTAIEARGALELDPDDKTFAADGSLSLKGATIADPRLADGPVRGIDVSAKGIIASKGDLSSWSLTGGAVELGKVRLEAEGGFAAVTAEKGAADGKKLPSVWLSWSVPLVACGDALASMPKGLLPKLEGMDMQGTFAAHGRLAFDARMLDKTQVDLFLEQKCRATKVPAGLSVERFREPFELRVYDPKGNPKTARFGPGTPEWATLDKISPYVVGAVLTCEDGAFYGHNGFSAAAIRNAVIANIKAGKFVVGASTVTMQLAKNVFLDRRKQLSRKLQEAVLTAWLEQAMSKSELLELYLNVIEFGPNLYGVGPASWHYFGRPPSDLDPLEATFLVSILPSPVKRHFMWEKGQVSDAYLAYLRALLKEEHARGKLEDDEYEAAIVKPLVFHKTGAPLPAPHDFKAVKTQIGKSDVDDPGFDPALSPPD